MNRLASLKKHKNTAEINAILAAEFCADLLALSMSSTRPKKRVFLM